MWAEAERVIGTAIIERSYSSEQARALSALGDALAQAGQEEQASQVWTEAERVIAHHPGQLWQAKALSDLATTMARTA